MKAFGGKSACKNRLKRTGYCPGVAQENPQDEGNVSQRHDRDQVLSYGANPLGAPKITRATRAPAKKAPPSDCPGGGMSPRKMSASLMLVTAVLIWVELPTPKAATMPKAQKSPPSQVHFLPRPF